MPKKNPSPHDGEPGASHSPGNSNEFVGTDNQRHLRALAALRVHSRPRESIDRMAGASNGPDLVAELRRRTRIPAFDRDGREVLHGVYHLTTADRRKLTRWAVSIAKRGAA